MTIMDTLLAGRIGGVEFTVVGTGGPVTLFAHGLGGSSAETRPLAMRVGGTRVLLTFRGHGDSAALPGGWDYDLLAGDLLAVADHVGATSCVGLSLGAGTLLRVLRDQPDRFARLGFVLPAALDTARADGATVQLRRMGAAIDRGDLAAVTAILLADIPDEVRSRRGVELLMTRRAESLLRRPAPMPLSADRPLADRAVLAAVRAPALVIGQESDPLHPLEVARELAEALPTARLLALPAGGVFWTAGRLTQTALADHLEMP